MDPYQLHCWASLNPPVELDELDDELLLDELEDELLSPSVDVPQLAMMFLT